MVETAEDWFCEAVWDGEFGAGDFDRTDLIFGSGARRRGNTVTFASSGSTCDRLHSLQTGDSVWVSNSLVCLLAATGASLDPAEPGYARFFESIVAGIKRYDRHLTTSVAPVRLTYFNNLKWNGQSLPEEEKPDPVRDFGTFDRYKAFLDSSLGRLARNMASSGRRHPFSMLGTLSSGYDSPAVVALAREHGLREALSLTSARGGETESTAEIAEALGLRVLEIERKAWENYHLSEVPFIAADASGGDVFLGGATGQLAGRVLLTGHPGGKVWSRTIPSGGEDIPRGDHGGLSLTEYRLWEGFIHCPAAFMGVRQIQDVVAISRSPEMAPWDVTGTSFMGNYSRPICRRIVEEAGVRREAFGTKKKAGAVLFRHHHTFLSPRSRADFMQWLSENSVSRSRLTRGRLPPTALSALAKLVRPIVLPPARGLDVLMERVDPGHPSLVRRGARRLEEITLREPLFRFVFPWAIERARERYSRGRARSESGESSLKSAVRVHSAPSVAAHSVAAFNG